MPITAVPPSSVDPVAQVVAALEAATATLAVAALSVMDRGSWVTSTSYAVGDVATQAGQRYLCRTAHTSGTFATDLASSTWVSLDAVAAAASSRAITAGAGLTGGGDLTADRTLAVSYGTTSGTAAQGNDSRIIGAAQSASLAAIATSGSAADLSAGSVPAGRFGNTTVPVAAINASGSASSSTFLRGDGAWQTTPGAVTSVVGQTGAVTGTQIAADAAVAPAVTAGNVYLAATYR